MSIGREPHSLDIYQEYPKQPGYVKTCGVNQYYTTLPQNYPRCKTNHGPNSVVHLYPQTCYQPYVARYPNIKQYVPIDTMYGMDSSVYAKTDSGIVRRINYGSQLYPFSTRNVQEEHEYGNSLLLKPDIGRWQGYTYYNQTV
jgi:hypothetical protein